MEPWRAKLMESDAAAAWDLFIERYQRLIFATIRHIVRDRDDVPAEEAYEAVPPGTLPAVGVSATNEAAAQETTSRPYTIASRHERRRSS